MAKLPAKVSGQRVLKLLTKLGYTITNRKGSHFILMLDEDDPSTVITVVMHKNLKKGTLSNVIKKNEKLTGMTRDEFLDQL